jgi:hypothetical protein
VDVDRPPLPARLAQHVRQLVGAALHEPSIACGAGARRRGVGALVLSAKAGQGWRREGVGASWPASASQQQQRVADEDAAFRRMGWHQQR